MNSLYEDYAFSYQMSFDVTYLETKEFTYLLDKYPLNEEEYIQCIINKMDFKEDHLDAILNQENFDLTVEYKEEPLFRTLLNYGYKSHIIDVLETYQEELQEETLIDLGKHNKNALSFKEYMGVFVNDHLEPQDVLDLLLLCETKDNLRKNVAMTFYAVNHHKSEDFAQLLVDEDWIDQKTYKDHLLQYNGAILWRIAHKNSYILYEYLIKNIIPASYVFTKPFGKFKEMTPYALGFFSSDERILNLLVGNDRISKKYQHEYHYPPALAIAFDNAQGLEFLINEGFETHKKYSLVENLYSFTDQDTPKEIIEVLEKHIPNIYIWRAKIHIKYQFVEVTLMILLMILVFAITVLSILNTLGVISLF
jgi:hypothetical protein